MGGLCFFREGFVASVVVMLWLNYLGRSCVRLHYVYSVTADMFFGQHSGDECEGGLSSCAFSLLKHPRNIPGNCYVNIIYGGVPLSRHGYLYRTS